jgi:hypothetical protein
VLEKADFIQGSIIVEMINPERIQGAGPAYYPMNLIPLCNQQISQI